MDNGTSSSIERYCTIEESIKESTKEVKLMCEGKIPKRNWRDSFKEKNSLNREKLWKIANNNTKKNELGQTTISSNDYTFDDNAWDEKELAKLSE